MVGVAVAGGTEGKHLPEGYARFGEDVEEAMRVGTELADAVGAGKRCWVEENTRGAGEFHGVRVWWWSEGQRV